MEQTFEQSRKLAYQIRQDIIQMLDYAKSGHSAGPLGLADIFVALYFHVLRHDPKNPSWEDRDRFVLSNGHTCPVLYATLARAGYFPVQELKTLRTFGSRLQGHPHRTSLPGLETTSGPLGSGIAQAVGMCLGARLDNKKWETWVVASDGELQEGNSWEAIQTASRYHLNSLTVIIDRNNIQIDGFTEQVMPLEPLKDRFEAFGWHVLEVDGHNIEAVVDACNEARSIFEKPVAIIAHTIPGKGVDFMEFNYKWHGEAPGHEDAHKALAELRTLKGKVEPE